MIPHIARALVALLLAGWGVDSLHAGGPILLLLHLCWIECSIQFVKHRRTMPR